MKIQGILRAQQKAGRVLPAERAIIKDSVTAQASLSSRAGKRNQYFSVFRVFRGLKQEINPA